ncbi:GatB/YqeY domain-containing protein [Actinospica durhamensis]|uniref:GatB/YqeY domain-containing protein n=1 Tax=Actinospica durhamensis TaxID=1508375 RepID=A0A941EZT5_9ACTN|nr:GatB/YqeY domain-containing protein [Actinospica durhamensis]MBR7839812.1 GatB/YqeY domain-containing protein [Actinospica durhamensis]
MSNVNSQAAPEPLQQRLRTALPTAMRARDKVALAVLRSTLAAIENAEAVELPATPGSLAIEQTPVGAGAAEAPRRELTEADVERIVRAELAERDRAAQAYDQAGQPAQAEQLRTENRILTAYLLDPATAERAQG